MKGSLYEIMGAARSPLHHLAALQSALMTLTALLLSVLAWVWVGVLKWDKRPTHHGGTLVPFYSVFDS